MQDEDNIIDVGEADYEETEVNLDTQPESKEEPREEIEVQQVEEPVEQPVETKKEELDDYSDGVQKRIAKLTRRMREAERQKEEAIQYAQNVNEEAQQLKQRFNNLDSNYTKEFEKRVTTNLEAAKSKLQNAINLGDVESQTQANLELAELANDHARLSRLKSIYENKEKNQTPAPAQRAAPLQPAASAPDPRADAWAAKNTWFGTDNAMTYTAFDIHKNLVEEGYDPNTGADEYYSEVDKRIRLEFPHKFGNNESTTAEPVQTVASAKRPASTKGRRKTVKLTPSQVAISKRLGVPLEEYAKQLAAKEV
jgi:hypothetical protein